MKFNFFNRKSTGKSIEKSSLQNVYLATVQKSGSQWILSIFNDPEITKLTKLKTYPQHHYDGNEFHEIFPENTLIPGLYVSYLSYWLYIKKKEPYKTLYIYRDPRDLIVSWYWSALKSHALSPQIKLIRKRLETMTFKEGILYAIRHHSEKFGQIRSWIELGANDENVLFLRFEDIVKDPLKKFIDIFNFLGISITPDKLQGVLNNYTKEEMRKRDMQKRSSDEISHYRKEKSDFREVFEKEHYQLFYNITGDLVEVLGYDK